MGAEALLVTISKKLTTFWEFLGRLHTWTVCSGLTGLEETEEGGLD